MFWFKNKKQHHVVDHDPVLKSAIEIIPHQNAKKLAVEQAKRANEELNNLLTANGFTLKIYLAAGGGHSETIKKKA